MLPYFAFTLFVSASLLFLVQPMVGKMILPQLGGTPAVWNTCMVFFQAVLLVGYGYTHNLSTRFSRTWQFGAQMTILLLPLVFFVLPFSIPGSWTPDTETNPIFSVLWLLVGMVGLPFFVVATSAPLLQKWFADTGHPAGKDPYFLYGASNLGSMLALMLYPLAVEPLLAVGEQAQMWTYGYCLLALLVGGCMLFVWLAPARLQLAGVAAPTAEAPAPAAPPPTVEPKTAVQPVRRQGRRGIGWKPAQVPVPTETVSPHITTPRPITLGRRLRWLALAAVPSSLMLGVMTHLTTDVAAIPFFWVIPLALYLLTFILVFSRWPVVWTGWPHNCVLYAQPFVLVVVVYFFVERAHSRIAVAFTQHVLVFFLTTLMCHGELAKDRPGTKDLTEFYLWMSLGGVLGGIFNVLIAPLIFWTDPIEYPLAMVCACFLRPRMIGRYMLFPGDSDAYGPTRLGRTLDWALPLGVGLWTMLIDFSALRFPGFSRGPVNLILVSLDLGMADLFKMLTVILIACTYARPLRFGLSLAIFLTVTMLFHRYENPYVYEGRDFFGFVRVRDTYTRDAEGEVVKDEHGDIAIFRSLVHGETDHGWEKRDPDRRRDPITYFHPNGGIGQVFEKFSWCTGGTDAEGKPGGASLPFAWPDHRVPAAMIGMGASPFEPGLAMLLQTQTEPAYACVGLGIGTLGAHAKPFQYVRFYEIQPAVKTLSLPGKDRDGKDKEPIFHFIHDALERGANIDVILGDGRLTLNKDPVERYYHVLVIDAFASDAIPVHLLTKEAVEMYLSKLADGGLLVFNTTNKYVDLRPVLRDLADDLDLACYHYGDHNYEKVRGPDGESVPNPNYNPLMSGSDWVVLQRRHLRRTIVTQGGKEVPNPAFNGGPPIPQRLLPGPFKTHTWEQPEGLGGPIWTDRYSNLLRVLSWR